MRKSVLTLLFCIVLFSSFASAAWTITDIDSPSSLENVSNLSETVQMVQIKDGSGNPITPSMVSNANSEVNYVYNGSRNNMTYLKDGYWYANFDVARTGGTIEYEVIDNSPGGVEINETETLNVGNVTVEILTNFSKYFKSEETVTIKANATYQQNNSFEGNANVDIYFTNGSWTSEILGLAKNTKFYSNVIKLPRGFNSTFVMHVNASATGASYNRAYGSSSTTFNTYPAVTGVVEYLNTSGSGCNNQSFFDSCESGATVNTGFNATVFPASDVKLELVQVKENGNWEQINSKEMNKSDGLWRSSFDFPSINTSAYKPKLVMQFNATIQGNQFLMTRNITSESFIVEDKSAPTAYQGDSHDVELLFAKYFSREPLNDTAIDRAEVDIKWPNSTVMQEFNLSDMSFSETKGLFNKQITIPNDAPAGTYETDVKAWNRYNESKMIDSGFTVKDVSATFNVSSTDIEVDYNKTDLITYNFSMTNKLGSDRTIEWSVGGELKNFTTLNGNNSINLSGSETRDVKIEFDVPELRNYEGNFTLEDGAFNKTIDLELDAPSCDYLNASLCVQDVDDEWINITSSTEGFITRTLTVLYVGEKNKSVEVESSRTGDIASYLEIDPWNMTLSDEQVVSLNYSVTEKGNYTGHIKFTVSEGFLRIPTKLVSDIEALQAGISTTSSLDLGSVDAGSAKTLTIDVENTGDFDITGLNASSSTFDVMITDVSSVSAGETVTASIRFADVQTAFGTVTVEGTTSEGDISQSISISGSINQDQSAAYEQKVSDIQDRITSLSNEAGRKDASTVQTQLQSLEIEASNLQNLYDNGDTEEADQKYQELSAELDSIDQELGTMSAPNPSDGNGDQIGGSDSGTDGATGSTNQGGDASGFMILGAVLLVLLVVGFIFYTSYIPEEGDPLYSVLGGK